MPGYRLTRAADDDLTAIFLASIEMFGLEQADSYHAGLVAAFEFVADHPFAARLRGEINPPIRASRYKAHMIVYDIQADGILIVRVRHGREDWMNDVS